MKKVSKVMFDCNGFSAPAYGCDKPGDHSGYYVQATDYDELTRERDELAAQVERLRCALIESADDIDEWMQAYSHDGHSMQVVADSRRLLAETPAQSLEAVKREWTREDLLMAMDYASGRCGSDDSAENYADAILDWMNK